MLEKSLLIVLGVAVVGFVGYEIVKREKPELLKKAKKSLADAGRSVQDALKSARSAFMEGYASA